MLNPHTSLTAAQALAPPGTRSAPRTSDEGGQPPCSPSPPRAQRYLRTHCPERAKNSASAPTGGNGAAPPHPLTRSLREAARDAGHSTCSGSRRSLETTGGSGGPLPPAARSDAEALAQENTKERCVPVQRAGSRDSLLSHHHFAACKEIPVSSRNWNRAARALHRPGCP